MAVQSNDTDLKDLLQQVGKGKIQLPDFQRSWVWDDAKICKLIESITMGFPMGALMFLETGGVVNYKPRLFTGVDEQFSKESPDFLVLDGQQRLTTLYQVFMSKNAVVTCFERNKSKEVKRFYYIDIRKAIDPDGDMEDAIISIADNKMITSDIGKTIVLDLTTKEKEYEQLMMPLNILFSDECHDWLDEMEERHYDDFQKYHDLKRNFRKQIIEPITKYKLPVIRILKDTSQASVCQIFENVNRGGVPLNVFELVTASLAAEGVELRLEWDKIEKYFERPHFEVLKEVTGTDFITSLTLWESYEQSLLNGTGVKCKKKDVMNLRKDAFVSKRDGLKEAFLDAARFMVKQGIYTKENVPYTTQFIPLAAIYAYDNSHQKGLQNLKNLQKLAHWFWCGVFGELYGSANETRYASDIKDFFAWVADETKIPDTVSRASFQATRLLTLQTRNSAAYKGVMALILKEQPLDFAQASPMSIATYTSESTDIHHIFPAQYCIDNNLSKEKWNSVVNKTMIYATTNRSIGGAAPSIYIPRLFKKNGSPDDIIKAIKSHQIDFDLLQNDSFDKFIVDRATKLLDLIEQAMGKSISSRNSEETLKSFGAPLLH